MEAHRIVIVDRDRLMRKRLERALAGHQTLHCACAWDLLGGWPPKAKLFVRDVDRELNAALMVVESTDMDCPVVAYGTGASPERLRELFSRGVAAYWNISGLGEHKATHDAGPQNLASNDDDGWTAVPRPREARS